MAVETGSKNIMVPAASALAIGLAITGAQPDEQAAFVSSLCADVSRESNDLSGSTGKVPSYSWKQSRFQDLASGAWKVEKSLADWLNRIFDEADRIRRANEKPVADPEGLANTVAVLRDLVDQVRRLSISLQSPLYQHQGLSMAARTLRERGEQIADLIEAFDLAEDSHTNEIFESGLAEIENGQFVELA